MKTPSYNMCYFKGAPLNLPNHQHFFILNSMNDAGAGFGTDSNKVTIIGAQGVILTSELKSKPEIAKIIIDETIKHL